MRYIRPFDLTRLRAGTRGPWLVRAEEDLGVAIRAHRGGADYRAPVTSKQERFLLMLAGAAQVVTGSSSHRVTEGALLVVPPGADAAIDGLEDAVWLEIEAPVAPEIEGAPAPARVVLVDASRFEGTGFAYQSLADRETGCRSLKLNVLHVQPGAGSPDFHIHAFAQLYVILEGEMSLDIGRARYRAEAHCVVCLPPGVVHRNFNASTRLERHVSLLVPEPGKGDIFDYAVDIHGREAELLKSVPGKW